jgi:hypothetical protein
MTNYREIFQSINYPDLLNTIDDLKLPGIPPWDFIRDNYHFWKSAFEKVNLFEYGPIARMINDDVIATINIDNSDGKIYLFVMPISDDSKPFRIVENINLWLRSVLEDSYEYITRY